MYLKILSAKWQPFCPGGDGLMAHCKFPTRQVQITGLDIYRWWYWKHAEQETGSIMCFCCMFLAATKQLYEWYFLSVCPSVPLSVRLSHLFDYVPIIVSSWNFQELSPRTRVRSMQKVKVRGQRSRSQRSRPNFSFPDCNSSLNSHMIMKWYI